jgi:hypothetical protein
MSSATRLIYDKKFQNWYLNHMAGYLMVGKGYSAEQALNQLVDSFNTEINCLKAVLEALYPNSRPDPKHGYVFITEPMEHELFYDTNGEKNPDGKIEGLFFPGRMHVHFNKTTEKLVFPEEPTFKHGHLTDDHRIRCWGGYHDTTTVANTSGFSAVLTEIYNFASHSRYGTSIYGEKTPQKPLVRA